MKVVIHPLGAKVFIYKRRLASLPSNCN
jgi:hypothetical protein